MPPWQHIADHIAEATGEHFQIERERSVGGGCINSASVLEGDGRRYFVKLNDARRLAMFEAEAEGLRELAQPAAVRVPAPVCWGTAGSSCYLVLEYLALGSASTVGAALGRQLAALHRHTGSRYGWLRDNTIGSTPQVNTPEDDWVTFWRRHRLGYQLDLALANGAGKRLRERGALLDERLHEFFSGYQPQPSLLHGDLWSGNYGADDAGNPVIFDPAVYYGDREVDIAMTELFGGFGSDFYNAYNETWALDAGYARRKNLYNLYHVLNHYNLFGGGYLSQAEHMIDRLLMA